MVAHSTLNSVNDYTGATTVNAGILAGNGTIASTVTVNSGGTLSPGSGGVGTLTVNNNLLLNAGSTNVFEVNGTTLAKDVIAAGGSVTYGGMFTRPSGTFANGQSFTLFSGASAVSASNFDYCSPGNGLKFHYLNGMLECCCYYHCEHQSRNITAVVNNGKLFALGRPIIPVGGCSRRPTPYPWG